MKIPTTQTAAVGRPSICVAALTPAGYSCDLVGYTSRGRHP